MPIPTAPVCLLITCLTLLGPTNAQETVVTKEIAAAVAAKSARQPETAARHLHTALRALNEIGDEARSNELRAEILAANADVDKTLERRIEVETQAAQRFEATVRQLMAAGYPTTAQVFARQLKKFDSDLASTLGDAAKALGEGRSKAEGKRDKALAILLQLGDLMVPNEDTATQIRAVVNEVPEVGDWLDARRKAAAEFESLAKSYSQRRFGGIAWELLSIGFSLDSSEIDRKLYDKLSAAVSKAAAAKRQQRSVPSMAQFKAGHEKFGRSKKWKISGKLWRSPKPGKNHGLVLSEEVIKGDYQIEVSLRLPRPKSSFQVVAAARGPDDYLVVHCERKFGSLGEVRIAHVSKGSRKDLAGFQAQGVLDGFLPMKIDVTGNTVSLHYSQRKTVALPFVRGEGLRYGFALPPTTKEKVQKDDAAEIRDLIVTRK